MSLNAIYNFESAFETTAQSYLNGRGITAATTQDSPSFQKSRPRVELMFLKGSGMQRWAIVINGKNAALDPTILSGIPQSQLYALRRESAWQFSCQFDVLTNADMVEHSTYRVQVRALLAQLWTVVNSSLPYHSVELIRDAGDSEIKVSPQLGYYKTEMKFEGMISVQADAWLQLIT